MSRYPFSRCSFMMVTIAFLSFFGFFGTSLAQNKTLGDDVSRPIPGAGHNYIHGLSETVNPANGSLHVKIDLPVPKGRGFRLPFAITYDSGEVYHFTSPKASQGTYGLPTGANNFPTDRSQKGSGWSDTLPYATAQGFSAPVQMAPYYSNGSWVCPMSDDYNFYDPEGGSHMLGLAAIGQGVALGGAPQPSTACAGLTYGGFGYSHYTLGGDDQVYAEMSANCDGKYQGVSYPTDCVNAAPAFIVADLNGNAYSFPNNSVQTGASGWPSPVAPSFIFPAQIEDRNGNIITFSSTGAGYGLPIKDSLGRTLITSDCTTAGCNKPTSYTVGGLTFTLQYSNIGVASFTVGTNEIYPLPLNGLGCGFSNAVNYSSRDVLTKIILPNNQFYSFGYDLTYGLLNDITYPDGGRVHYLWGLSANYSTLASFDASNSDGSNTVPGGCDFEYQTPVITERDVYYSASSIAAQTQTFVAPGYSAPLWTNWSGSNGLWSTKINTVTTKDNVTGTTLVANYTYVSVNQPYQPNSSGRPLSQVPVEQSIQYTDGSRVLKTVSETWADQYEMTSQVTTPSGMSSYGISYCYVGSDCTKAISFSPGPFVKYEYDIGQVPSSMPASVASPGAATRTTLYGYYGFTLPCHFTAPITGQTNPVPCPISSTQISINSPSTFVPMLNQVVTYSGGATYNGGTWSGSRAAETDIYYDGQTSFGGGTTATGNPASVPTGTHDENNYAATSTTGRGNPTAVIRWSNNGSSPTVTYAYDETGQVVSKTDACGLSPGCSDMTGSNHTTTYSYGDNPPGGNPAGNSNAYLTQVQYPTPAGGVAQQESFTYNYSTGELASSTDRNSKQTPYQYDSLLRLNQVNYPDGGVTKYAYDSAPFSVTECRLISGSNASACSQASPPSGWKTSVAIEDGLGHITQNQLPSDPDGTDYTDIGYDGMGLVHTRSNPHRSSSSGTDGTTIFSYDALGRTVEAKEPDGSGMQTIYDQTSTNSSGTCATTIDEAGNPRKSCSDALGRLIEVDEPGPGAGSGTTGSGVVNIGGSEQYGPAQAGTATASLFNHVQCSGPSTPEAGTVSITVNGVKVTESWGGTCTGGQETLNNPTIDVLASRLASDLTNSSANVNGSPQTCGPTSTTCYISITAKTTGANTNYGLSTSYTVSCGSSCPGTGVIPGPSSPTTLTGGTDAQPDSGTVSVIVNGNTGSANYTSGWTAQQVASAIAASFADAPGFSVTQNGASLTFTASAPGADSNYGVSTSVTWSSGLFSQPSFTACLQSATCSAGTSNGNLSGGKDPTWGNSGPLVTLYTYDVLDNVTCVVQKGTDTSAFSSCTSAPATWRPRSFQYDSLSRLTSAANPESGTITYTYDLNGNLATRVVPKAGQTGTALTTHNYTYDVLNRQIQESHLDPSSGTDRYAYDGTALTGCPGPAPPSITGATNLIGRRSAMCSGNNSSSWSYDPMGRPLVEARNNKGSATKLYNVSYTYYQDGSLKTLTYPSGDMLTYSVGGAERPLQVTDSSNNFATSVSYTAFGLLTGMTNGLGIVTSNTYNNRLQPFLLSSGVTGQSPIVSLCYDFHLHAAINSSPCTFNGYQTGDNGNVFQIINNVDSTRSAAFVYDTLNRITQANTLNTNSANCWGETYTIDAWGNLTNRGGVTGMSGSCYTESLNAAPASTKNQLNGPLYDAAGNVTNDGNGNLPTYDSENRIATDAGVTYSYDADGFRMEKSPGNMYWPGPGGEVLTETDLSGNISAEYVYFNGARIARVDRPSGTVHYYFSDHLGSASAITDASGNVQQRYYYYPYGGMQSSPGSDPNHYKFTGKERDAESGLDMFGARYYASTMGRFMTPDWSRDPDPVPYADYENPQTLNLYQYVENNPLNAWDPDGHAHWGPCLNDSSAQCWTGDKNGEVDKANGTVWNGKSQQWEQPPPPSSSSWQQFLAWRQQFKDNWDKRIEAHRPPPQKRDDNLQFLQNLNNLMMGMVPIAEPLVRDITGKVHGDLPDHVPDSWTREDLEQAQHELQESIKARNAEQSKYGEEGGHRERIRREEHLLRQVDKKLSGS